ncbi:MAG TPA: hypothetical protein VGB62_09025 [Allosphingosinicella sp.]|jgi:hypothetical protein
MHLAKLDLWIGKNLFVPPIIRLCQLTRQSQFAVARLFWFIAALDGLYRANTPFGAVVFGALSVVMMLTAALRADMPTTSTLWFRMFSLAFLTIDIATGAATGKWAGVEFWLFALIAEYAGTIRTIPPMDSSKRVRAPTATQVGKSR